MSDTTESFIPNVLDTIRYLTAPDRHAPRDERFKKLTEQT